MKMESPTGRRGRDAATLRVAAYKEIRRRILDFTLPPGAPLSEYELAEQLGISRTPIREAMRDLASTGLVRAIPRLGMFVAEITAQDVHEIYEIRIPLESHATAIATRVMAEEHVAYLQDLVEKSASALTDHDLEMAFQAGDEFHKVLLKATSNRRLQEFLGNLHDQAHLIRHTAGLSGDRPRQTVEEHREIVISISARDGKAAESAMRRHLIASRDNAAALATPSALTP